MDTVVSIGKRLILPAGMLLFFYIGYSITLNTPPKNSTLDVEVVPRSTEIIIDGKTAGSGKSKVTSGTHTIEVKRSGFSSQSRTVTTQLGDTTYAGFIMQSNTEDTKDWYKQYKDDAKLAEAITGRQFDNDAITASNNNSLLQQVPVTYGDGHGGLIQITSGVPIIAGGPPAIYIRGQLPSDRQAALTWMRSNGYNPATMDIVFPGQVGNYLEGD